MSTHLEHGVEHLEQVADQVAVDRRDTLLAALAHVRDRGLEELVRVRFRLRLRVSTVRVWVRVRG